MKKGNIEKKGVKDIVQAAGRMSRKNLEEKIVIDVTGALANCTRPEFRAEGTTYDVITYACAKALVEATYWHPQFEYIIEEIHVINPIKKITIKTNGINKKQSYTAKSVSIDSSSSKNRVQKNFQYLKDVRYIITAHIRIKKIDVDEYNDLRKYYGIYTRRLAQGQYHKKAYLGLRECVADVRPVTEIPKSNIEDINFGFMHKELDYAKKGKPSIVCEYKMVDGVIKF